jgi:hypothetical protein
VKAEKPKRTGAGRPTKHTDELLEKARAYLLEYPKNGEVIPSIVGLALHCGISKQRVYEWLKDEEKDEFRYIAMRVEQIQELKLASGGLTNEFNANITKLLLSKHGYSDRQEVDHTTGGEKIFSISPHQFAPSPEAAGNEAD